jgi:hypothetical protein
MSWTEAQLLSDLDSRYGSHSAPAISQAQDSAGYTWMVTNVLDSGTSEKSQKPTAQRRNIFYYVYHRGLPDEQAWYSEREPDHVMNTDIAAAGDTGYSYAKIFNSQELRTRVLGLLIKAAYYIIKSEPVGAPNHAIRLALSKKICQGPAAYLDAFMSLAANNGDVRSGGNGIAEATLDYVVNVEIVTVATIYGL